jgi:hypothetical protein
VVMAVVVLIHPTEWHLLVAVRLEFVVVRLGFVNLLYLYQFFVVVIIVMIKIDFEQKLTLNLCMQKKAQSIRNTVVLSIR